MLRKSRYHRKEWRIYACAVKGHHTPTGSIINNFVTLVVKVYFKVYILNQMHDFRNSSKRRLGKKKCNRDDTYILLPGVYFEKCSLFQHSLASRLLGVQTRHIVAN